MKTITPLLLLLAQSVVGQTFTPQTGQRWKSNSADTSIKVTCSDCAISGSVATTRAASVWLKNSKGFNLADGFTIETTFIPNTNGWLFLKEGTLSMRLDSLVRFDYLSFPSDPLEGTVPPQFDYYSGPSTAGNGEITIPKGKAVKVSFAYDQLTGRYGWFIDNRLDPTTPYFWTVPGQACNNKPDKAFELFRAMTGTKITNIAYKPGKPTLFPKSYRVTVKPDSVIIDLNDYGLLTGDIIVKGSVEGRRCIKFSTRAFRTAYWIPTFGTGVNSIRISTNLRDDTYLK